LSLIFEILIGILLAMLLGLSLIAVNLQKGIELVLIYVFLFFEKTSMKTMVKKNLSAHRQANKLTSIIFSLALGTVIFTMSAAKLNV